jgi:hypothetical protein
MRTVVLIASVVLMAGTADGSIQIGALGDLIVEEASFDPSAPSETGKIVVRVRNQGKRTIVAWGVYATLTDANGGVGRAGGGIDGFEYDVIVLRDDPVLRPNYTYTIRLHPSQRGFEPVSATAFPDYAIFDDNSAVGDERSIELWFQRRAQHAAGWRFVEGAIKEALANATPADDVLRFVEAKLGAAPKDIRDSPPGLQVVQRIRIALRSPESARSLVEELSAEAGTRAKAAAARSIRRR